MSPGEQRVRVDVRDDLGHMELQDCVRAETGLMRRRWVVIPPVRMLNQECEGGRPAGKPRLR